MQFAALILPVFWWRHYVTDKGVFPSSMTEELRVVVADGRARTDDHRAGILPYLALAGGILAVALGHFLVRSI